MASMSAAVHLTVLLFFWCYVDGRTASRKEPIWRDCTNPNSPMKITNFDISPRPVSLPGEILFTMEGYSNRTIGSSALQFHIVRKLRSRWFDSVTIPCLFKIGSCTYPDMCTMLDEMSTENWAGITSQLGDDIKDMLRDNNMRPGVCPQPPQVMSIVEHRLSLPAMPSILSFFADGVYEAHLTVTDNESGEELQCFDIEIEVQLQEEECTGWFCMFG